MAGSKVKMGVASAACLAVVLFQVCSAATSHVVGDSTGWTIPSTTSFYSSWASKETFLVRDFLVFNFVSGAHTVAEVTKSDYDSCSSTSPITLINNGPANLTISSAGTHYYICTISGHCSAGQKLSITASAAPSTSSPAPKSSTSAPTPKSTPSPTASPPTKSAAAPTPKSTTSPTASPAPKSSAAAPTPSGAAAPPPSSGAPTPSPSASSPSPASSPGPSGAGSPEIAPTPSTAGGPASSPSPATSGSLSPPAPSTPTEAPSSTPGSDSPAAGAGLVLPLVVVIGAIFLN